MSLSAAKASGATFSGGVTTGMRQLSDIDHKVSVKFPNFDEKISRRKVSRALGGQSLAISAISLSACGSSDDDTSEPATRITGYPSSYSPPKPTASTSPERDQYADSLAVQYVAPYWVDSLSMDGGQTLIGLILFEHEQTIKYAFPDVEPTYDMEDMVGWAPASELMVEATREIFAKLSETLNVTFSETTDLDASNVMAVGVSKQSTTAAFAYFPNPDFLVGSDVFIAQDYTNPQWVSGNRTNYDYEVLLHEIGHALGLKHPFESDGANAAVLDKNEDQTKFTTMSYDDAASTFNGTFRPLDWMTLTKFYGVNSMYRAGDDTYTFSSSSGVFVIDGSGIDVIDAAASSLNAFIDLRPGMQNSLGPKTSNITSANQMTISHGSVIENVVTGGGSDVVVGNETANEIKTGAGNDTIYAGEGADVVNSGAGEDQIDLSETVQLADTLVFDTSSLGQLADTVYGFAQGLLGDALDLSALVTDITKFLPLVSLQDVPSGLVDSCIVRLVGDEITSATALSNALTDGGALEAIDISVQSSAIFVVATSQETGVRQDLYYASNAGSAYQSTHLAEFIGDYLDIDAWTLNNFEAPTQSLIA